MDRIRVRWEVPHNSEGHLIVLWGRIGFVIVVTVPRGRLSSNMANVSRRAARGRVRSITLDDGKLCVGSNSSIKHGCNVENSLDPCKFIVGSHNK
jgi:hypothetical protein